MGWWSVITRLLKRCSRSLLMAREGLGSVALVPVVRLLRSAPGLSSFELLYRWDVQGPLDLLKKMWTSPEPKANERGIVQFVLQMRDQLAQYREEAAENLRTTQQNQKRRYNKHAQNRSLEPGQKVLLLLPSSTSRLLAKRQGP